MLRLVADRSAQHLERVLTMFIDHYNGHRAHRSLGLAPPHGRPAIEPCSCPEPIDVNDAIVWAAFCTNTNVRREHSDLRTLHVCPVSDSIDADSCELVLCHRQTGHPDIRVVREAQPIRPVSCFQFAAG